MSTLGRRTVSLEIADATNRRALENLMQLYVYDWSELRGAGAAGPPADYLEVGEDGRFKAYPLDPWFSGDPRRHPFLIRAGGVLAGFALAQQTSRLTKEPDVFDMAEFFVLRGHRRAGIGASAARRLFERFRGTWEIRQRKGNATATAFWRRVASDFTAGKFEERMWDDETWCGPVQRFSSVA
jgi:predicted acetyltransferase